LGAGSTYLKSAGSWGAGEYEGVTGQVNLVGTNGATFYLTGVQLEKGSTATSFDYRDYGRELAMCMRYFQRIGRGSVGRWISSSRCEIFYRYAVPIRIGDPSLSVIQATGEIYEAGISANVGATIGAGGASIFSSGTTTGGGVNLQSITGLSVTPTVGGTAVLMHDALGISAEL
jgi:hypothetical protein